MTDEELTDVLMKAGLTSPIAYTPALLKSTDEELTTILQYAGLDPPESGYTQDWLKEIAGVLMSRPSPWPVDHMVILVAMLKRLEEEGMTMTQEEIQKLAKEKKTP